MASTMIDSILFRDMFGAQDMRALFSDEALIARYIEAEIALARAEADVGIIPQEAGEAIAAAGGTLTVDWEKLRIETLNVGYPILPLVHQLSKAAGEAGRYVHWGATTQDMMDTASVLQMRAGLDLIERDLKALQAILQGLAQRYRDTLMAGRTHLQQALPITFGYKAAVWLSMIDRHLERLAQLRPRLEMGQFAGAVGTLASIGEKGLDVQAEFCRQLGLKQPSIVWHVARDGIAEAVAFLGLVAGALAKIATDVMLLMATEIGEVAEPFAPGRGGSSTMPQKRNPISCELIIAGAKSVRQQVGLALDGMAQDLERATGPWHLEWLAIPEAFILTSGALANAKFMLGGLIVDEERMRENLSLTNGLIVAEAVMMAAAVTMGRQKAHDLVYDACRQAIAEKRSLADILKESPEMMAAMRDKAAIDRACDPAHYAGLAREMVDRALEISAAAQASMEK